jgi:hypothetical protein
MAIHPIETSIRDVQKCLVRMQKYRVLIDVCPFSRKGMSILVCIG